MEAISAYIQFTPNLIDQTGKVTRESTEKFLKTFMAEFHVFIERALTVLPRQP